VSQLVLVVDAIDIVVVVVSGRVFPAAAAELARG